MKRSSLQQSAILQQLRTYLEMPWTPRNQCRLHCKFWRNCKFSRNQKTTRIISGGQTKRRRESLISSLLPKLRNCRTLPPFQWYPTPVLREPQRIGSWKSCRVQHFSMGQKSRVDVSESLHNMQLCGIRSVVERFDNATRIQMDRAANSIQNDRMRINAECRVNSCSDVVR